MVEGSRSTTIAAMLAQIRSYQQEVAEARPLSANAAEGSKAADSREGVAFSAAMRSAIDQVNAAQGQAAELRDAFERGENVPLTDVVISMQKASLAFETTLQVRNKVMRAYEDIKNMPV